MSSNSWKTALTHFSQRYKSAKNIVDPRLYKNNEELNAYSLNHVIVCCDHLHMKLSNTPQMPYLSRMIS
jgi:hypothetical protein